VDGDVIRVLVAADTFHHATVSYRIPRIHRQIPWCA